MVSSLPVVSVIMSVYNGMPYLGDAIQSILDQSFKEFEFIIIDDGSKDASAKLISDFAKKDSRIVPVIRENKGLIASLNEAASLGRGKFLARMDADDLAMPDRFAKQLQAFDADQDLIALGTWADVIDGNGVLTKELLRGPVSPAEIANTFQQGGRFLVHPTLMMRTDAYRKSGGYRMAYKTAEDLDLVLRLLNIGRVSNLPETLLLYRVHGKNVSIENIVYQETIGAVLVELAHDFKATGNDRSGMTTTPPSLSNIETVFNFPGLREKVLSRMIAPTFVGDVHAMRGDGLKLAIERMLLLRRSKTSADQALFKSMRVRALKAVLKQKGGVSNVLTVIRNLFL
jgi:glycosyltransferase involved in cell wall biosynthesis